MPKHDFLTPKAISNRIKARGLQKLRWYCQLCQKQCRDENGFKCHQTSATHRRNMELFGQNAGQIVSQYSRQFEMDFMAHMRVCHPTARVHANKVYNEFIKDKDHIHMNSTRWLSLSGFVQYLAKKGLVKIEPAPKGGWFMQMVPKSDENDLNSKKKRERDASEKQDDVRQMREIQRQIKKAAKHKDDDEPVSAPSDLLREEFDTPISFSMQKEDLGTDEKESKKLKLDLFGEDVPETQNPVKAKEKRLSKLEEIHSEFSTKPEKPRVWLQRGIVVKVLSTALKEHGYYKKKGFVRRVIDSYIAELEMLDSGDIIRVDQTELETVLPALGGKVSILNGSYKGSIGKALRLDVDRFSVEIEIIDGDYKGHKDWFEYEDVSKLYNQQICP